MTVAAIDPTILSTIVTAIAGVLIAIVGALRDRRPRHVRVAEAAKELQEASEGRLEVTVSLAKAHDRLLELTAERDALLARNRLLERQLDLLVSDPKEPS